MAKEMLINSAAGQECRIAIMEDGRLEELYVERMSSASHVGNIYKGRISNVEPSIQAAFVDFGMSKNGFLHISDVHPQYFPHDAKGSETVGRKRAHRDRPPIQHCLRRGQEVVVQMTKEGIGTKGPTLTTYLSIPGRLLVMMPGMSKLGVSRKIEDDETRNTARDILNSLKLPGDMGFILRTAGMHESKRELQRDLNYLTALWKTIKQRIQTSKPPAEIYQESDLITRTIRDVYNSSIDRIVCDSPTDAEAARDFLKAVMPRTKHRVEVYTGREGLFHDAGLEQEIEGIYSRRVEMKSGGSLVIDQTEALVAIDVNSGRYRAQRDAEATATKINLEAAVEVARQLRLRDLGGVIVIDFIDMRDDKNRRAVEKAFKDAIKPDRAKSKVLRISNFGIMEMTRQRMKPSLKQSMYTRCPHCDGTGFTKSAESAALIAMRNLQRATSNADVAKIEAAVAPDVAQHLANYERKQIAELEEQSGKSIFIRAEEDLIGEDVRITCWNSRGSSIAWEQPGRGRPGKLETVIVEQYEYTGGDEDEEDDATESGAPTGQAAAPAEGDEQEPKPAKKRRRRGGRKHKKKPAAGAGETPEADSAEPRQGSEPGKTEGERPDGAKEEPADEEASTEKKKRRGRRGGRKHKKKSADSAGETPEAQQAEPQQAPAPESPAQETAADADPAQEPRQGGQEAEAPRPKATTRRRKSRKKSAPKENEPSGSAASSPHQEPESNEPPREERPLPPAVRDAPDLFSVAQAETEKARADALSRAEAEKALFRDEQGEGS